MSRMHAGCTFSNLGVDQEAALIAGRLASASFVNCTFAANSAATAKDPPPPVISATGSADVRLERCEFPPVSPATARRPGAAATPATVLAAEGNALYFSDAPRAVAAAPAAGEDGPPAAMETLPLADVPVPPIFLQGGDEWLLDTQQVRMHCQHGILHPSPGV